jgi:acetolactate synthase-1/2/3 large subunit
MMQALADSVPMLVVTAVAERAHLGLGEGRLHELPDQRALASQCTRFSHTLMDPSDLPKVLARAFAVFSSERPGPVHIELPLDIITADASEVPAVPWPLVPAPVADHAALHELGERLRSARRPCLLVGGGAVSAAHEVRALAEARTIPVITTINAKGVLPVGHDLLVGGSPSLQAVRDFMAASDLILAIGTEFGETDYDMLFLGELPELPFLARLDIDASQLCRNQRPDLALCGAAAGSLRILLDMLEDEPVHDAPAAVERVAKTRAAIAAEPHVSQDFERFFATVGEALPDLCLVGDSTLPTYHAVWQYEPPAHRRYFHSATGAGTLGYAIPAAVGARRALPEQVPVVALIGDGSAQFTFMELASAVQERLPVIVLIWNNEGYREIQAGMIAADVAPIGVDIDAPDFVAAATALGCRAQRVTSLEALADALVVASQEDLPTVLDLPQEAFCSEAAGAWYGG